MISQPQQRIEARGRAGPGEVTQDVLARRLPEAPTPVGVSEQRNHGRGQRIGARSDQCGMVGGTTSPLVASRLITTGRAQAQASSTLFLMPTPERIGAIDTQDRARSPAPYRARRGATARRSAARRVANTSGCRIATGNARSAPAARRHTWRSSSAQHRAWHADTTASMFAGSPALPVKLSVGSAASGAMLSTGGIVHTVRHDVHRVATADPAQPSCVRLADSTRSAIARAPCVGRSASQHRSRAARDSVAADRGRTGTRARTPADCSRSHRPRRAAGRCARTTEPRRRPRRSARSGRMLANRAVKRGAKLGLVETPRIGDAAAAQRHRHVAGDAAAGLRRMAARSA